MGRDRIEPATPDLFSTDMVRDASAPSTRLVSAMEAATDTASKRYVLPKDLPNALKYLTDRELDLLITASVGEAKRRGRLLPTIQTSTPNGSIPKRLSSKVKRQAETASLSPGQINAVRAAFKAGVTPSRIARQFGISQSDVRRVLASKTVTQEGR
jgi:predicted DNA binding protein